MKQTITLLMILWSSMGYGIATHLENRLNSEFRDTLNVRISKESSKIDSVTIRNLIALLENTLKTKSLTIDSKLPIKDSGIENIAPKPPVTPDTVIIDTIYHKSMFYNRYNKAAIGFENFFIIKNFDQFKKQYLINTTDGNPLVLFVNGKPFPNIRMSFFDEKRKSVSFMWNRSDSLTKAYAQSSLTKVVFRIKNPVIGFGYADQKTKKWVELGRKQIDMLYVIKRMAISLVVILFALLSYFFWYLGKKTNLLREGMNFESPFSLALTQFAFWTVIIFSSYFYLWLVTFELVDFPDSTLALLGITSLTTVGSKLVDIRNSDSGKKKSQGFINDLLSEGEAGISVHRCQLFVITILFGAIYLVNVFSQQALPEFKDSLLWVIGISSGAFVGIKSVEEKVQENSKKNAASKAKKKADGTKK